MVSSSVRRLVLRAVVHHRQGDIVTHSLEVGRDRVAIACSKAFDAGTTLRVVLSFPTLVREIDLFATVVECRADDGYGHEAAVVCDVVARSPSAEEALSQLLADSITLPAASSTPSLRCLLVEDNGFIRDLFSYGMEKYGSTRGAAIALDAAADAEQAWAMLRDQPYDVAIIDHYLPMQNGSHLIARMRGDDQLAGIPVVAISVGGVEARQASMDAGADLFLDKPIVMRDLFATLDRLTRTKEAS